MTSKAAPIEQCRERIPWQPLASFFLWLRKTCDVTLSLPLLVLHIFCKNKLLAFRRREYKEGAIRYHFSLKGLCALLGLRLRVKPVKLTQTSKGVQPWNLTLLRRVWMHRSTHPMQRSGRSGSDRKAAKPIRSRFFAVFPKCLGLKDLRSHCCLLVWAEHWRLIGKEIGSDWSLGMVQRMIIYLLLS